MSNRTRRPIVDVRLSLDENEYRQRLHTVQVDVTPYRPSHQIHSGDPRWRRFYRTCSPDHPVTAEVDGNNIDGGREQLKRLITDPSSRECLFVHAIIKDQLCHAFAAATTTTMVGIEGGTPYNLLTTHSHEGLPKDSSEDWRKTPVWPKDIVRFTVNNSRTPVTIVSCDFDQQMPFLLDICRLKRLAPEVLAITGNEEWCSACFPERKIRGTFVTTNGQFLYCQEHARIVLLQYKTDLLLYKPTLVSLCANDTRVWLSLVEHIAGNILSSHFAYFQLLKTEVMPRRLVFDDASLLQKLARDWKWKSNVSHGPLATVHAMQYLCVRLMKKATICLSSECMGPPSFLKCDILNN